MPSRLRCKRTLFFGIPTLRKHFTAHKKKQQLKNKQLFFSGCSIPQLRTFIPCVRSGLYKQDKASLRCAPCLRSTAFQHDPAYSLPFNNLSWYSNLLDSPSPARTAAFTYSYILLKSNQRSVNHFIFLSSFEEKRKKSLHLHP